MRFHQFILSLIVLLTSQWSWSQKIKPEIFNFGKVKLWNNPEATFVFTNTTEKSVLFLPLPFDPKLQVYLPEGYIYPGEKREITVKYFTEDPGNFDITIPAYINTSPIPLNLVLKGNIKSFHPNALTICPRIDKNKSDLKSESPGTITVYDKKTGKVITGVDLLLENPNKSYLMEDSRKAMIPLKSVNIGLYTAIVSKEGYNSEERIIYINSNSGDFVFELEHASDFNTNASSESNDGSGEFVELMPEDEREDLSIERVRKMMNERFKGKRIIEKDVVVIKENPKDSATFVNEDNFEKSEMFIPISEKPDFAVDGTLNSSKYAFNNIVFLIDISGSMYREDKLPLLKTSIINMIKIMRPEDKITIITYASQAIIQANAIAGSDKENLYAILDSLVAKGNSFGAEGLQLAYKSAAANYIVGGNNHVILASDGMFNSKDYSESEILNLTKNKKSEGIRTSTIFFGKSRDALSFMKALSLNGQGTFLQIKSESEAEKALIEEIKNYSIKQ